MFRTEKNDYNQELYKLNKQKISNHQKRFLANSLREYALLLSETSMFPKHPCFRNIYVSETSMFTVNSFQVLDDGDPAAQS